MTRLPVDVQTAVDRLAADGITVTVRLADDGVLFAHIVRTPFNPGRSRAAVLRAPLPCRPTVHVN